MPKQKEVNYVTIDGEKLWDAVQISPYDGVMISRIMGKSDSFLKTATRRGRICSKDLASVCLLISRDAGEFVTYFADKEPTTTKPVVTQPIMATAQQADRIIELLEKLVDNSTREVTLKLTSKQATAFGNWLSRSEDQFDTIIDVLKHIQTGVGKLITLWRT